ncbi:MAG: hypothetical protein ACOX7U_04495 [Desulfitobacteriia bacterium]|jgi:hypothetical protein
MFLRKILLGILIISLQFCLVGGATTAYFYDEADPESPQAFKMKEVKIGLTNENSEQYVLTKGDDQTFNWKISNLKSNDLKVRVRVIMEPTGPKNTPIKYSGNPFQVNNSWTKKGEYYYYQGIMENQATIDFELIVKSDAIPQGEYKLAIEVQALQHANTGGIYDQWPILT